MNLVDVFILLIIAVCVLEGVYRGFVYSVANVMAFFVSWLTAIIFYPLLSSTLINSFDFASTLATYVEGAENLGNVENARLLVSQITETDLNTIVNNANFPQPFPELIKQNVHNQAFSQSGLTTLGEYTNQTISVVVINIVTFLIIFFVARVVLSFAINALDHTVRFPVLKQFDGLLGGGFGLVNGIFIVFVIFMIVPAFMAVQSAKIFQQYFDSSLLGPFFYQSNFILNGIHGVI